MQREVRLVFRWPNFSTAQCRTGRMMPPCRKPARSAQTLRWNTDLGQTDRQTDSLRMMDVGSTDSPDGVAFRRIAGASVAVIFLRT